MVATLTALVVDVVRTQLLRSEDGLPLGLITAQSRFSGLNYFWSPEFWYGRKALRSWRKRLVLTALLIICGFVAVFAGPASATLLLPTNIPDWPAGATNYTISGNESALWPRHVTKDHIPSICHSPTLNMLQQAAWQTDGCAWDGYTTFNKDLRTATNLIRHNLTIADLSTTRVLQQFSFATLAPHVAVSSPAYQLGLGWTDSYQAIQGVISSYAHYKRNINDNGITLRIQSYMPFVRSSCVAVDNSEYYADTWQYPFLPSIGFPSGYTYTLSSRRLDNTSSVAMQWVSPPTGSTILTNNQSTSYYPSTFLNVRIPVGTSIPQLFTCSIDARWVMNDNVIALFNPDDSGSYYAYGDNIKITNPGSNAQFPYFEDWLPINLATDWLDNLSPLLNSSAGYTTISDIFTSGNFSAKADISHLWVNVETIISTIVADGLSRLNYQTSNVIADSLDWRTSPAFRNEVYRGRGNIPPPNGFNWPPGSTSPLRWRVFINGYGYRMNGAASWIAVTVLLVYATLSLGHITYRIFTRISSDAWESSIDLIALAQNSAPSRERLANTCGGVAARKTLRTPVKIREVSLEDGEQIQMVYDDSDQIGEAKKVRTNIFYGTNLRPPPRSWKITELWPLVNVEKRS